MILIKGLEYSIFLSQLEIEKDATSEILRPYLIETS